MNIGSVVLPFVCGSRQEELSKVSRMLLSYAGVNANVGIGKCWGTGGNIFVYSPSEMRKMPALTISSLSHFSVSNAASSGSPVATALSMNSIARNTIVIAFSVASGLVAGNSAELFINNALGYLNLDARFTA